MQKLYDYIFARRSIRTFKKSEILDADLSTLNTFLIELSNLATPFGNRISPMLINQMSSDSEKIGTYGFVKNASAFIAASIDNELSQIIDYGYIFELIVLHLVSMDLGSVWLGGTFDRSSVKRFLTTQKLVPAVLAIGYPSDQSLTEKTIRFVVKASNRKPLEELVTNHERLTHDEALTKVFEALRIAPSGSNQQPWRINLFENHFELVLKRTPGYAKELNYEMQGLDMGIAMAHLELALSHFKIDYEVAVNKNLEIDTKETLVATYKIKKPY